MRVREGESEMRLENNNNNIESNVFYTMETVKTK
jgi:hypothetical protein